MGLINCLMRPAFERRLRQLYRRAADPGPVQERILARLVRRARHTEWGRAHDYAAVRSVADFQARVPLATFEDLQAVWERIEAGERDLTWPGRTRYFAMSAGTTSGSKHVPVTADAIRTGRRGGRDVVVLCFQQMGRRDFTAGRFLYLGGSTRLRPAQVGRPAAGEPGLVGDSSGIMSAHVPVYVRRFRLPGPEIAAIENWEERVERICQDYLRAPVEVVAGLPSWVVPLFERLIEVGRQRIGPQVKSVSDVWPRLGALVSYGMAPEPYMRSFSTLVGRPICYIDTYSSSEGGMGAVQDRQQDTGAGGRGYGAEVPSSPPPVVPSSPGMLVLPDHGVFYEFVRLDEAPPPGVSTATEAGQGPRRYTLADVEPDVAYEVAISTNAGIWGYRLGDVVRFVTLCPHRLAVVGRTRHQLTAFGEHVIGEELEAAILAGCEAAGGELANFTVQSVFPQAGSEGAASGEAAGEGGRRHRWYVEFRRPPGDPQAFLNALDQRLKALNEDYASYRKGDRAVGPPELVALAEGTFYAWMKRAGRLGGQFKIPRVLIDAAEAERLKAVSDELARKGPQPPAG